MWSRSSPLPPASARPRRLVRPGLVHEGIEARHGLGVLLALTGDGEPE